MTSAFAADWCPVAASSGSPRVILLDIETSPNVGYIWGKYEQNVIAYQSEWQLLSMAWKLLGEKKVHCISRPQFKDKTDKMIAEAAWDILATADVVIAHNGARFDIPKLRAKFIEHNLPPLPPLKVIDTRKIARSQFMFNSNSLNDLAATLKLGAKAQTGGFDTWLGCMNGDKKAWKRMIEYNIQDVVLLERVYERLAAWYPNHPNLTLYAAATTVGRPVCPVCSSDNVQRRGYNVMKTRRNARLHCQDCRHWFSAALKVK